MSALLACLVPLLVASWVRPPDQAERGHSLPCATHLVLYDKVDTWNLAALEEILPAYDLLIVNERSYSTLPPRFHERCLLYFNPYGKWEGSYSSAHKTYPVWQPGPGDLDQPRIILNKSVACYTWDEEHAERFLAWVDAALAARPRVAGIFLDDWSLHRDWWVGDDAVKRRLWPGWPDSATTARGIRGLEGRILATVRARLGAEGLLVCNGTARHQPGVRRMAEDLGRGREIWENLLEEGNPRELRSGDLIQLRALNADGALPAERAALLERAVVVAAERGCSVGLGYRERPESGGSVYQLPRNRLAHPDRWLEGFR